MFANYLRLVVFSFGLLVGVQVPGFVDQYAKRADAHLIEVSRNFAGFQETADRYFGGNVEALIAHHVASADQAFRDEARSIREMYGRLALLRAELAALQGSLVRRIVHVVFRPNKELLDETRAAYTYTVIFSPAAVICGVSIGALLAMLVEALLVGSMRLVRPRGPRVAPTPRRR
jgi:hypothetical protein